MLPITDIAKNVQRTVKANSPAILTGFGVAGVVSTAILSVKATFKAADAIVQDYYDVVQGSYMPSPKEAVDGTPFKDQVKIAWKFYIPPAVTGALSIGAIIGSNKISSNRSAALVTAYSLTETAFKEYKDKVVEQIGENKERKVRDAVAEDKVARNHTENSVVFVGNGDVLCYDLMTDRYFMASKQKIENAENTINRKILNEMYASLNEFWSLIGLNSTGMGEEVGWNMDTPLEVQFTSVLSPNSEPCLAVGYRLLPIPNYYKIS